MWLTGITMWFYLKYHSSLKQPYDTILHIKSKAMLRKLSVWIYERLFRKEMQVCYDAYSHALSTWLWGLDVWVCVCVCTSSHMCVYICMKYTYVCVYESTVWGNTQFTQYKQHYITESAITIVQHSVWMFSYDCMYIAVSEYILIMFSGNVILLQTTGIERQYRKYAVLILCVLF